MKKIFSIVESISHEKGISYDKAMEAFKEALINTAKRLEGENCHFDVEIDKDKQEFKIYRAVTVISDEQEFEITIEELDKFISITDAKYDYGEDIEIGDVIRTEINLDDYGRTAASNLLRELEYHIQRQIENELFEKYKSKVGKIIIGTVTRIDERNDTHVEIGELKGILSQRNRIKGESFRVGDTIKALLRYVKIDKKTGMSLELSRTSPKFLEELLKKEVPEIQDGYVEIVGSSRIPGERAKVALKSDRADIDPVGSTVGQKGVRINAVSQELNGENIDCIEYSPIPEIFVSRALSPAIVKGVKIENKNTSEQKAVVDITADQKAKAIGKSGINIRLASMLTKFQIELNEVEGVSETASTATTQTATQEKNRDISALENLFK